MKMNDQLIQYLIFRLQQTLNEAEDLAQELQLQQQLDINLSDDREIEEGFFFLGGLGEPVDSNFDPDFGGDIGGF